MFIALRVSLLLVPLNRESLEIHIYIYPHSWATSLYLFMLVAQSCPPPFDPWAIALLSPLSMEFSSKNTGVGCDFLVQGISLTLEDPLVSPGLFTDSLPLHHCLSMCAYWHLWFWSSQYHRIYSGLPFVICSFFPWQWVIWISLVIKYLLSCSTREYM